MLIHFFARARDLAGADHLEIELTPGATVADLRRCVAERCPRLAELLGRCAIAVDNEFASDELALPAAAEVAVLPPVSGG